MCGRFANPFESVQEWREHFGEPRDDLSSTATMGYNVAPTQMIPVVTRHGSLVARWGLIPSWAGEITLKFATHNARSESVATKPTFRHAWNSGQRCVVPALGYYEWKKTDDGKQPFLVRPVDSSPLAFGGLYEPARGEDIPASCTILTLPASEHMVDLHPRMPFMLGFDQAKLWLSGQIDCSAHLTIELQVYKISAAVNDTRNQGSSLVTPATL